MMLKTNIQTNFRPFIVAIAGLFVQVIFFAYNLRIFQTNLLKPNTHFNVKL
jgi:hypothetical protein